MRSGIHGGAAPERGRSSSSTTRGIRLALQAQRTLARRAVDYAPLRLHAANRIAFVPRAFCPLGIINVRELNRITIVTNEVSK